jgi:hypothetical protein
MEKQEGIRNVPSSERKKSHSCIRSKLNLKVRITSKGDETMGPILRKTSSLLYLLAFCSIVFAQDIIDIPPVDGSNKPLLVSTIAGDTTESGERKNPDRIYRLERDGIYALTATLVADYSLTLIAEEGEGRPPIIFCLRDVQGANIRPMMRFTKDNAEYRFSDIIFNYIDRDRNHTNEEFNTSFEFKGDATRLSFTRCVFNYNESGAKYTGEGNAMFFRDCVWRNAFGDSHPFMGQSNTFFSSNHDTLVVTNCTFFNNNSYLLLDKQIINHYVFEHNTIYANLINGYYMPHVVNANIRSNIFYGYAMYGDDDRARTGTWYESEQDSCSVISITEVPPRLMGGVGLTEADRVVNATHNAYFQPQQIKDYWADYNDVDAPHWMNKRTRDIFNNAESYPYMHESNNLEVDPNFTDTAMDTWVMSEWALVCRDFRDVVDSLDWGSTERDMNYDAHLGDDVLTGIRWPLPENLAYSNETLLTGGHDGLPVGDLNWFPDKRPSYEEPKKVIPTSIRKDDTGLLPSDYQLSQNYPNPFNPATVISFKIPKAGFTTLKVFNILGQEVATLVNENLRSGAYSYDFNGMDIPSGLYFYQLKSEGFTKVKKMMLLK